MRVIRFVTVAALACTLSGTAASAQTKKKPAPPKPQVSTATKQKAAETNSNVDALVLQDFQKRVAAYMAVHKAAAKDALPIKETNNPGDIKAAQESLAAHIRMARA